MKLRNKIAAITAASMLAFAGVGFAAWVFNKDVETTSTANVVVTTESEQGTLTINTTSLYIILDQAEIFYASDAAGTSKITKLEATYTAVAAGNLGENMDVTFSLAFSGAIDAWSNYVNGLVDPASQTITTVNGANAVEFALPALTYTANKPSTESQYDDMYAALNGKTLTLTVTANAAADDVAD